MTSYRPPPWWGGNVPDVTNALPPLVDECTVEPLPPVWIFDSVQQAVFRPDAAPLPIRPSPAPSPRASHSRLRVSPITSGGGVPASSPWAADEDRVKLELCLLGKASDRVRNGGPIFAQARVGAQT